MNELTKTPSDRQLKREAMIDKCLENGMRNWCEAGQLLAEVKDTQEYAPHATFEEHCQERWGLSRSHAWRLMKAAVAYENIKLLSESKMLPPGNIMDKEDSELPLPTQEAQLRPLVGLEPEIQAETWVAAVESANGQAPTPAQVKAARKPAVLCNKCDRLWPHVQYNCAACRHLKEEKAKEKARAKREAAAQPTEKLDAFKNPIPKRCLSLYSDPWLGDTIDLLAEVVAKFRGAQIGNKMQKRMKEKHYPFLDADKIYQGLCLIDNTFDEVIQEFKDKRPVGVCPSCDGAGGLCNDCRTKGLVHRDLYKVLKERKK